MGTVRAVAVATILLAAPAGFVAASDPADLEEIVAGVERAFAKTMADRDHAAFASFLSEEAVFLSGTTVLRGRRAVAGHWKRFFDGSPAPFAWEPETVSVLESGTLAISTGPVRTPDGRRVSTFTSVWRQEEPGVWRIVFDKGDRYCE
jgi:ketosteroid isomerase-like protein